MSIVYPAALDTFSAPGVPQSTSLSSGGTSNRNHPQSHDDLGKAIMALEANASPLAHDHSGTDGGGIWPTNKLAQANTHLSPDTDAEVSSLHHTIGSGPTNAAAGNHAHDYNGASIFNQPVMICTSLTRPVDPVQGMVIYELDTKCYRAWDDFNPENIINLGIQGTDLFERVSNTNMNVSLWSQNYITGNGTTNGTMATPNGHEVTWTVGTDTVSRCIARRVNAADAVTETDDQVLDMYFGTFNSMEFGFFTSSPTDDAYLRMSADGQSYVRFCIDAGSVNIYWTKTGPAGEAYLGGTYADTRGTSIHWTFKAIGRTFIIYQGDGQICAVVDNQNVTAMGANYRGWGIGMQTAQNGIFEDSQLRPASIDRVTIADQPFYTGGLIWQLLPIGAVPSIRAEAHFRQVVVVGAHGGVVGFDTILEDWFFNPFMNVNESQTDIVIQETGHYDVRSSISWDPNFFGFDSTMVGITVNGLDIGRKVWNFMRGNGFAPGFSQTNDISFSAYLVKGDILRVQARHNADFPCWLWFFDASPDRQMSWVEATFRGV